MTSPLSDDCIVCCRDIVTSLLLVETLRHFLTPESSGGDSTDTESSDFMALTVTMMKTTSTDQATKIG